METKIQIPLIYYIKSFFKELLKVIFKAPIIYYSTGLKHVSLWCYEKFSWYSRVFGVSLSIKTLFRPLYQDYSKEGRVAGFVVRLFMLFFRIIELIFLIIFLGVAFLVYSIFPFAVIYFLINTPSFL